MKTFYLLSLIFLSVFSRAQIEIGIDNPDPSSALEIYAVDKGLSIPETALTSVSTKSPIDNAVDGLIIFNTTENPSLNLYKGLYYWSDVSSTWENIVLKDNIPSIIDKFGVEIPYVVSNETVAQTFANNISSQLTFSSSSLNNNSDFTTGSDSKLKNK